MNTATAYMGRTRTEPRERVSDVVWGYVQQAGAVVLLLVLSPLMALIAVVICLDSPGGPIFRQRRPGWRGREFTVLKFRTMRSDAERSTGLGVAAGDARITRVGAVLRASKADELPQLWNIATGQMRLVGPRPLPRVLDETLRQSIPGFEQRYRVKPGLTSLAQVCVHDNGLDDRLVHDWSLRFEAERRYIHRRCVTYDLIVILLTVVYVLRKAVTR